MLSIYIKALGEKILSDKKFNFSVKKSEEKTHDRCENQIILL